MIEQKWVNKIKKELNLIPIYRFPVLWEAWECDSDGFVCKDDNGNKFFVFTNHGTPYITNKKELRERIKEYKKCIKATEKAFDIFKK